MSCNDCCGFGVLGLEGEELNARMHFAWAAEQNSHRVPLFEPAPTYCSVSVFYIILIDGRTVSGIIRDGNRIELKPNPNIAVCASTFCNFAIANRI